jgi:HAD superfamily hydrolase (TIGR01509 family)
MKQRPFEAIIFDHDGTLIDTESPDLRACQMLYNELDAPFNQKRWAETVVGSMDGYNVLFTELIQWSDNGLSRDALWKRLRALWKVTYENVELMPGVKSLLSQLHVAGYPLGVASASDRDWIVRWLTSFDLLPYFQIIASSDDVSRNKPAPDIYLFAAAQLEVEPERCLVFEDSLTGVQAAKSAGMVVVAVPNIITRQLDFSHADAVVEGLADVTPEWIVELGARFIVM